MPLDFLFVQANQITREIEDICPYDKDGSNSCGNQEISSAPHTILEIDDSLFPKEKLLNIPQYHTTINSNDETITTPFQGTASNCWLVATLKSLRLGNPKAYKQLVKKNHDNTYSVFLYLESKQTEIKISSALPTWTNHARYHTYNLQMKELYDVIPKTLNITSSLIEKAVWGLDRQNKIKLNGNMAMKAIELLTGTFGTGLYLNKVTEKEFVKFIKNSQGTLLTISGPDDEGIPHVFTIKQAKKLSKKKTSKYKFFIEETRSKKPGEIHTITTTFKNLKKRFTNISYAPFLTQTTSIEVLSEKNTLKYKDGSTYQGDYIFQERTPVPHGKGTFTYIGKTTYEGDFSFGKREGYGKITHSKGSYSEGTYYSSNGDHYTCTVSRGYKQGLGTYYYADGNLYTGMWKNDKQHGPGTVYFTNGSKEKQTYRNGNLIK